VCTPMNHSSAATFSPLLGQALILSPAFSVTRLSSTPVKQASYRELVFLDRPAAFDILFFAPVAELSILLSTRGCGLASAKLFCPSFGEQD